MSSRVGIGVVAGMAAIAAWWCSHRTHPSPPAAPALTRALDASPRAAAPVTPPPTSVAPAPPAVGYRRLDPAARRALMDRIAQARTAGRTSPPAGELPAPAPLPGTLAADQVLQGFLPLMPALKDCYDDGRAARTVTHVRVTFAIHLVGEPEVGTLIDALELAGDEAFRADPELATCLRETLLAVELPPLSGGSTADFKTTLVLADEEPPADAAGGP